MRILSAILAFVMTIGAAQAATLTFDGMICNGDNCSNGGRIDQTYGDIAGQVDVIYDADRTTAVLDDLYYWSTGYETLTDVAYSVSGKGMSILFQAAAGYEVSVLGLDIAPYLDRVRDTAVTIYDTATNSVLFSATETPLSTTGVTNYSGNWTSATGILIEFGPDSWDVAIDNIVYTTAPSVAPVPVPASGLLLVGALSGFGLLRRRRKS